MYITLTLKSCEKNKNGVERENIGIDDIEMTARDWHMRVHYSV